MTTMLEQGEVYFFYRPRVGVEEVRGLDDVQRFLVVLEPDGGRRRRELVVGRKRLPDPRRHERAWALVAAIKDDPQELRDELGRRVYETRTRGVRVQPEARPAGEGRYAIVRHEDHTHLAYVLELPRRPGEAQELFNILPEASFIVAVRNPEAPAPAGSGLPDGRQPELPPELRERFGGRRFTALDPPAFLDHPRVQLVLIGAAVDASEELGIDLGADDEQLQEAGLFRRLRLRPGEVPTDALERGALR
jgi:hypothetical protein